MPTSKATSDNARIFLGMPGYGKQTAAAGRGLWRARADMSRVHVEYRCGSLLAANFNALWCGALNAAHRGEPPAYFAMLHDDVGPEDFWLDKLVAELEENDLDVLGVAVPIKDTRGLTSLAIDGPDQNTWRPKCRLTMAELFELPPTFTSEHVGGDLLLNTGCWVCKFDLAWARQVRFTINDRIVFDRGNDRYVAEVEPEDWYFSRLCHELDLKIGATRKVAVAHRGEMDVRNTHIWGEDSYDRQYVSQSTLPGAFPHDVPGWLLPEEGQALTELARGKRVLEIGSYCGRSTICLARTAEHVVAVDYFDGRGTPEPRDTASEFWKHVTRYRVARNITTCHPDAEIPLPEYDLVFIDGAHDRESVERDIAKAYNVLARGGLLAFHDYRQHPGEFDGRWDQGVTQAVDGLLAAGGQVVSRHATLAVVKPPSPMAWMYAETICEEAPA